MFNTTILDVAIGMVFIYLLLSILCSAASELIEMVLKKRATDLERGIRELLKPSDSDGVEPAEDAKDTTYTKEIVRELYNHPLINSLFVGRYETSGITSPARYIKGTKLPSYIPARNFALALMDVILPCSTEGTKSGATGATVPPSATAPAANQLEALRTRLAQIRTTDPQLADAVTTLIDAGGNDVARVRANIEDWFNSSMDRVSGWYKRRTQIILLTLGFIIAITFNADSVLIVRRLASDRPLRDSLVAAADAYAKANASPSAATPASTPKTNAPAVAQPSPKSSPTSSPTSSPSPAPTASSTPVLSPTAATPASAAATPTPEASPTPCWKEACEAGEDTPECKLKKAQCEIRSLGLPIGWNSPTDLQLNWYGGSFGQQLEWHLFGWVLTSLAISLGAPFWFDLLNKFIVVRSTVKPKEKSPEEKPK
jgi:hypothetical protein